MLGCMDKPCESCLELWLHTGPNRGLRHKIMKRTLYQREEPRRKRPMIAKQHNLTFSQSFDAYFG